jgi:hypothetical protein
MGETTPIDMVEVNFDRISFKKETKGKEIQCGFSNYVWVCDLTFASVASL